MADNAYGDLKHISNCFRALERRLRNECSTVVDEAEQLGIGIVDPETADAKAVWPRAWDKPLFANMRVATAAQMVRRLTPFMEGAWQSWGTEQGAVYIVKVGPGSSAAAFRAVTPAAQQVRDETRIAMHRLFAIQGAAAAFRFRTEHSGTPYADLVGLDLGVMVRRVQEEMGLFWGHITVLHFLADLGLACKPDRHVMRTVRHLWNLSDVGGPRVPNCASAISINCHIRRLVETLDGCCSPDRLRYVDKILMEISMRNLV